MVLQAEVSAALTNWIWCSINSQIFQNHINKSYKTHKISTLICLNISLLTTFAAHTKSIASWSL